MSGQLPIFEEFLPLLDAACDGALGETQFQQLTTLLDSDPLARKAFIEHVRLRTNIQFLARAERARDLAFARIQATTQALPPDSSSPAISILGATFDGTAAYFSSGWPVAYLVATAVLGIGLLIGGLVHVPHSEQVAEQKQSVKHDSQRTEPQMEFVGRITGMVNCRWADPNTAVPGPVAVPLGRKYALASGLLEITYETGAKVILQGPVTYEVESRDGGYLSVGKLTARVEKKEERGMRNEELPASRSSFLIPHSYFAVRTPTATVTDLGTEFGVEVSRDGDTLAHVFVGRVRLTAGAGHGDGTSERVLLADQAARVDRGRQIVAVTPVADAGEKPFVRDLMKYAASKVISINFTYGDRSALDPTERTGVLRAANWNNVDASINPAVPVELRNGAGEPTRAKVSWQWAGPVDQPAYSCTDQPVDSREKLLSGFFCGATADQRCVPLKIAVSDLPYSSYRVFVCYWMDPFANPEHLHTFTLAINDGRAITIGRPRYSLNDFYRYQSVSESGNYQVFDRLSGDLSVTALPGGDASYHTVFIAGLQIVGISPPAECETKTERK